MTPSTDWFDTVVLAAQDITPTVREFRLQFPVPMHAAPGAHINVEVMVNGLPDRRSYSVVNTDQHGVVTIAVKHVQNSRGGSRYMWSLAQGARLRASAAVSQFEPAYGAPHYLLLAGGIGITPMVSLARALIQNNAQVHMLYAVRNPHERAYIESLNDMLGNNLSLFLADQGATIDLKKEIDALPTSGQLYMCGPIGLMDAVRQHWSASGRPGALLRYETFGSSGHYAPEAFTIRIPRLGLEVHVPQDRSMLDALSDAGVAMLSNCRKGECGLCAVDITAITGKVDHRDVFFSQSQHQRNEKICACVSRVVGGSITIEPAWRGDPDLNQPELLQQAGD